MAHLLLLPCPRCGDPRPELRDTPWGGWGTSTVYCPTCQIESEAWNSRAQSVLKWNTAQLGRSAQDIQNSLEARLRDIDAHASNCYRDSSTVSTRNARS
jgi:uncharacterized Zn finger protein (UPF0148 family)